MSFRRALDSRYCRARVISLVKALIPTFSHVLFSGFSPGFLRLLQAFIHFMKKVRHESLAV
jgi:hypothetical protein